MIIIINSIIIIDTLHTAATATQPPRLPSAAQQCGQRGVGSIVQLNGALLCLLPALQVQASLPSVGNMV